MHMVCTSGRLMHLKLWYIVAISGTKHAIITSHTGNVNS